MLKSLKSLMTLLLMSMGTVSFSQEVPVSWNLQPNELEVLEVNQLESFDHEVLLQEDILKYNNHGKTINGRVILDQYNPVDHGTWEVFPDGSKMWRAKFASDNAKSLSVYLQNMYLPVGSSLFVYNENRTMFEGPYSSEENNEHGKFLTSDVSGDVVILEYFQPADVVGELSLETYGFGYFYRMIHHYESNDRGGSQPCQVDVNCPEGDPYTGQKDGVVRLRITAGQDIGLCSGSLVNSTAMDCKNYVLTAYHCTCDVPSSDYAFMQVRFNFERSGCGAGSAPATRNKVGVFRRADSDDNCGSSGSDFALLEMEDAIPSTWNPFYAGWDASGAGSNSGVSIHHPNGDVKKISSYDSPLSSSSWNGPPSNTHWSVEWAETETDWGVTEGGSSGSPIYNAEGLIIGTLTGGGSFCSTPWIDDSYGKMSYHWTGNPNPSNEKLKKWLDPEDTGETEQFGAYGPNCSVEWVSVKENELQFADVSVFPNPANDIITFRLDRLDGIKQIIGYDIRGAKVLDMRGNGISTRIDISGLDAGIYHFTVIASDGQQVVKKVTIL